MTDYVFSKMVALDATTGEIVRNATGQVFAITDTAFATPLTVRDAAGVASTTVQIGAQGVTPDLIIADLLQAVWRSGDSAFVLTSPEGPLQAALAAQDAAVAAAAEAAATAALVGAPADTVIASVVTTAGSATHVAVQDVVDAAVASWASTPAWGVRPVLYAASSTTMASTRAAFVASLGGTYTGPITFDTATYAGHPGPSDMVTGDRWDDLP